MGLHLSRGGETYFYHLNARGDVVAMSDSQGAVVNTYTYDPWGAPLTASETVANPYRYASYRYDTSTGLYYCWNRYYAPEIARFLTRDIYPGELSDPVTMNPYLYCGGDPVNRVDPSGLAYGDSLNAGERFAYGLGGVLCQVGGQMIQGIGGKIMLKGVVMFAAGMGWAPKTAGASGAVGTAAGGCTIAGGASVWVAGATVNYFGQDLWDMAVTGTTHSTNLDRIAAAARDGDSGGVVREYLPRWARGFWQ